MRFRTPFLAFVSLLLVCLVTACNKTIGTAYVLDDQVAVYSEPGGKGQPLGRLKADTPIAIKKKKVPDERHGDKRFWYRVESADLKGYVSYDEELQERRFISFQPAEPGSKAFIMASALRLREYPGLSAKTLRALKHGEIVDVVREGSVHQVIDGRSDTWLEVRTKEGKVGYSYAGYMHRGKDFGPDWKKVEDLRKADGYVCITAEQPAFYSDVVRRTVLVDAELDDPDSRLELAGKGRCMPARKQARHGGKTFFQFLIQSWCFPDRACQVSVAGWVSEDHAFFTTDPFEFEIKSAPVKQHDLIRAIAAGQTREQKKQPLRPTETKIKLVQLGSVDDKTEHFLIEMDVGFNGGYDFFVVARSERGAELLGRFEEAELMEYQGQHILVSRTNWRMSETISIHLFTGDGLREIFKDAWDDQPNRVRLELPYLTVSDYEAKRSGNYRYRLVDGRFKQIGFEPL